MTVAAAQAAPNSSQRRLAAALGRTAGGLLAASLLFPYWQARLFAPQYRNGLTATMYAYRVSGDVNEIDGLNHYIGMRKLGTLAALERAVAVPAVLSLAGFCAFAWRKGDMRLIRLAAIAAAIYPACFVADMAFWMRYATRHLDPTAPLKLRPFSIPILGSGRVAQFHSQLQPLLGFYLALAAAGLLIVAWWLARNPEPKKRDAPRGNALRPLRMMGMMCALLAIRSVSASAETLQQRLDAAPAGAVIDLPPGRYNGSVTIRKALTLRGDGRAVLDAGGRGTVVTIQAPGVALEGLGLEGSGDSLLFEDAGVRVEAASVTVRDCRFDDVLFGVFLVHAPRAVIEGNRLHGKPIDIGRRGDLIRSWNSDQLVIRDNILAGGRDFVLWFSTGSRVEGNAMAGGRYGLHFMYTNNAIVKGNRFTGNSVGLYVMYSHKVEIRGNRFERHRGPSGAGLGLKESDWITVVENDFIGNRQAVYVDGSPLLAANTNTFARNVFARNDMGLAILPGVRGNVFYENVFEDNLQQISRRGGGPLAGNEWQKDGRGNFWSDYAGYGLAGSSVGRIPYRVESAWEGLMDRQPLLRFFMFTPAAEALELAGRAFPIFRPKAVLTDDRPLLRPPVDIRRSEAPVRASWSLPMGLASLSGLLFGVPSFLRRRRAGRPVLGCGTHPALLLRAVRKSFGERPVLCGIDAQLAAGRTLVLWGPNGAGKSTLIKCLLGLHEFDGEISIFGRDASRQGRDARACLGYVAQEFAGYDWTVRQAMEFVAALRGVDAEAIVPALERCGLAAQTQKRVCDLSGGMKQKLALAQALLADPPLLILDEPCSNLDAPSRKELVHILCGLKGSRAIVMTSHRLEEVEALADDVLWLEEGRPSRLTSVEDFSRMTASQRPIWIELDRADQRERAVGALQARGISAALNGTGIWVEAEPGAMMRVVRMLEGDGFLVRDLRRELPT